MWAVMAVRDRVYLKVPFLQKDEAKAAGARWDPRRRQWWAPTGADLALCGRWIDPEPRQFAGRPVAVRVVQLPEACWKCGASSRPIVGVVLRKGWAAYPDGFVDFGECGEAILASVSAGKLADNHVGPIEWRRTKLVPEGYWANTCPYCSATFGNFPLYEGLLDAYNEGVERRQLPGFWVALPVDAFRSDEDYWAQEAYETGGTKTKRRRPRR